MSAQPRLSQHYLLPGELLVSETPTLVSTVLGSCVAMTVYAPTRKVGGICHAILPLGDDGGSFRYVDVSFRYLLHCFDCLDIPRRSLVIKLFGGACMFDGGIEARKMTVGEQNVRTALDLLRQEGLRPIRQDLGGILGRKLLFYPHTGEVLLKRLFRTPGALPPETMRQSGIAALLQ